MSCWVSDVAVNSLVYVETDFILIILQHEIDSYWAVRSEILIKSSEFLKNQNVIILYLFLM